MEGAARVRLQQNKACIRLYMDSESDDIIAQFLAVTEQDAPWRAENETVENALEVEKERTKRAEEETKRLEIQEMTKRKKVEEEEKTKRERVKEEELTKRKQERTKQKEIDMKMLQARVQMASMKKRVSADPLSNQPKEMNVNSAEPDTFIVGITENNIERVRDFVKHYCVEEPKGIVSSRNLHEKFVSVTGVEITSKSLSTIMKKIGYSNNNNKPIYFPRAKQSIRAFKGIRLK
jgi:hypothetical protein